MTKEQLDAIRARLDKRYSVGGCFIDAIQDDLRALLDEVERLTTLLPGTEAVLENEREYQARLKAEVGQLANESFRRGAEAMRQAVIGLAEPRATLPVKDGVDAAWCRSAQCIVDDVRVMPVPEDR
jgi:predicted O-methyltransferase YrrM